MPFKIGRCDSLSLQINYINNKFKYRLLIKQLNIKCMIS